MFNCPEAFRHLITKGFVYTIRPKKPRFSPNRLYQLFSKCEDSQGKFYNIHMRLEHITEVLINYWIDPLTDPDITQYVNGSGFESLVKWTSVVIDFHPRAFSRPTEKPQVPFDLYKATDMNWLKR